MITRLAFLLFLFLTFWLVIKLMIKYSYQFKYARYFWVNLVRYVTGRVGLRNIKYL